MNSPALFAHTVGGDVWSHTVGGDVWSHTVGGDVWLHTVADDPLHTNDGRIMANEFAGIIRPYSAT